MLGQLASTGVEIAHPLRFQVERTSDDYYYDNYLMTREWCSYPAETKEEDALLYWQAEDQRKREQQKKHFRESVEAQLTSPRKAEHLRLLLAERIIQEQIELTRQVAEQFIQEVALTPKKATKTTKLVTVSELDPDHIWRSYEEEAKRLKAYTKQWDEHLVTINGVGQLFLV